MTLVKHPNVVHLFKVGFMFKKCLSILYVFISIPKLFNIFYFQDYVLKNIGFIFQGDGKQDQDRFCLRVCDKRIALHLIVTLFLFQT